MKEKHKLISLALILLVIQTWLIVVAKQDYSEEFSLSEIKPDHFRLQSLLSNDLMSDCQFEGAEFQTKLKKIAKVSGLNLAITTNKLLEIDKVTFKQVFLVTKKTLNPEIVFKTEGLVVEANGHCYGLI